MSAENVTHPGGLTLVERVAILETKLASAVTSLEKSAATIEALQSAAAKMEATMTGYQKMASDFGELSQKIDGFLSSVKIGRQAMWMLVKSGGIGLTVAGAAIGALVWLVEHVETIGKLFK